jgi:hypothetical protein
VIVPGSDVGHPPFPDEICWRIDVSRETSQSGASPKVLAQGRQIAGTRAGLYALNQNA